MRPFRAQTSMRRSVRSIKANLQKNIATARKVVAAVTADLDRRNRESRWRNAEIPVRLWPMLHASHGGSEGGPTETPALKAVGPFLAPSEQRTILVLAGGVGTGKTVAVAWGCAFHGGRMVKALDLVRAGRLSYTKAAELLEVSQAEFLAFMARHRISPLVRLVGNTTL